MCGFLSIANASGAIGVARSSCRPSMDIKGPAELSYMPEAAMLLGSYSGRTDDDSDTGSVGGSARSTNCAPHFEGTFLPELNGLATFSHRLSVDRQYRHPGCFACRRQHVRRAGTGSQVGFFYCP